MRMKALLLMSLSLSLSVVSGSAPAQSVDQICIQQGHRPGSAGFYQCLQEIGNDRSNSGNDALSGEAGEAGSILGGNPNNAVTDYVGSTMSGATSPDPDILKQLNSPARAPK